MQENTTPRMVTELLKKAVAEKGQSGVARETGLTQPAIHRYLKGIGEPSTRTLKKLADYFGKSVAELRGDDIFYGWPGDLSFMEKFILTAEIHFHNLLDTNDFIEHDEMFYIEVVLSWARMVIDLPIELLPIADDRPGEGRDMLPWIQEKAKAVIEKYSDYISEIKQSAERDFSD